MVINWVSKILGVSFGFALLRSVIGKKDSAAPLSSWLVGMVGWLVKCTFPSRNQNVCFLGASFV